MTPQEFCYWLQGYLEVADPKEISNKQLEVVKEHLKLVFTKVTGDSKEADKDLRDLLKGVGGKHWDPFTRTYC